MTAGLVPALSIALAGLELPGDLGAQFEWAAGGSGAGGVGGGGGAGGYRAVQLNAAMPGARPRDLGRSARRDIAAMARRADIIISGVDLWIPPEHYIDPLRADRAIAAACEAAEFAAEIVSLASDGRTPTLSLVFPRRSEEIDASRIESAVRPIAERAQRVGAVIADHAWPADDRSSGDPIGVGVDPAAVFASDTITPAKAASRAGSRLAGARLSDLSTSAARVEPGSSSGRLDIMTYLIALATAGYTGSVVVDARGLPDPAGAARRCANLPQIRALNPPG